MKNSSNFKLNFFLAINYYIGISEERNEKHVGIISGALKKAK
jgi:hypothetical protein